MNLKTQEILSAIAKKFGLTITFSDGAPIRILGFSDGQPRLINSDQPESELVFAVLHTIALEVRLPLPLPWFLNRPYENDRIGETAYITRRIVRQKLNDEWRADLWALRAYALLGRYDLLSDFLTHHPDKLTILFWAWTDLLTQKLIQILNIPGRILRSLFHSTSV